MWGEPVVVESDLAPKKPVSGEESSAGKRKKGQ